MSNNAGTGATTLSFSSLLGGLFLLVALVLVVVNFWRMGNSINETVVLTGFVTELPPPNQQLRFGFGSNDPTKFVHVLFQSPEMSNISFAIARDGAGQYTIAGQDDQLSIRRGMFSSRAERHPPGESTELHSGDRIEVRGPLGRASFTVLLDESANRLRLRLARPLFYDLRRSTTRLVLGPDPEPVPSAEDELLFRTRLPDGRAAKGFSISTEENRLRLFEEQDLADAQSAVIPTAQTTQGGEQQSQNVSAARRAIIIAPGEEKDIATVSFTYRNYVREFLGGSVNSVKLFAFKLMAAVLLAGLAFLVSPHVRWPHGFLIYGCASLFVCAALVLSGRDALFYPHSGGFGEYIWALYLSILILCMLRIPAPRRSEEAVEDEEGTTRTEYLRLLAIYPIFVALYILIDDPFAHTSGGFWYFISACFKVLLLCGGALILAQLVGLAVRSVLNYLDKARWTPGRLWRWILIPAAVVGMIVLITNVLGGQEALVLFGKRIHLPTLLLPIFVVWNSVAARAADESEEARGVWLAIIAVVGMLTVGFYRYFSDDNGGAAILAVGLFISLWLSTKKRLLPALLALCLLGGGLGVAYLSRSPRFGLAWGGREVGVLYYDQEKNLRLARDMARAGGQGLSLFIPAEVRSNIHNDLIAAFVVGFFGWTIFLLIFIAFFAFYFYLFGGLAARFSNHAPPPGEEAEYSDPARETMLAACAALLMTFAIQAFWVMTASLQKVIPLTGLDLQPLSISTISVTSFFVVLLGSVALAHSHADPST